LADHSPSAVTKVARARGAKTKRAQTKSARRETFAAAHVSAKERERYASGCGVLHLFRNTA
jgi:hypothetical protein